MLWSFLLVLASARAGAQSCPTQRPSPTQLGISAGCSSSEPCPLNTPLTFSLTSGVQSCDTVTWNFGDGSTATTTGVASTSHTYTVAGKYGPSATVTNSLGSVTASMEPFYFATGYMGVLQTPYAKSEGDGAMTFTVTRSSSAGAATVRYATSDNGGSATGRYTPVSGTLAFAAGESSKNVAVPLINNNVYDGAFEFRFTISTPTGGFLIPNEPDRTRTYPSATVTILDDEPPPTLTFDQNAYTISKTAGTLRIVILRSGDMTRSFTGSWQINGDVATAFTINSGSLSFPAGVSQVAITLSTNDRTLYTGVRSGEIRMYNFSQYVERTSPQRGFFGDAFAAVTVTDPNPQPDLTVEDVTITEGNAGTKNAAFRVRLTNGLGVPRYLGWDAINGTAIGGSDYDASIGTALMPKGETSLLISIPIIGDLQVEPDETFTLQIAVKYLGDYNFGFPRVADDVATGRIINDDATLAPSTLDLTKGVNGTLTLDIGVRSTPAAIAVRSSNTTVVSVPSIVTIPAGSARAEIPVTSEGAGTATITATLPVDMGGASLTAHVTVAAKPPALTSVSPVTGPASGGTVVTVTGTELTPDCTLLFGGTAARNITFVSPTTITGVTRAHAEGAVEVAVSCAAGRASLRGAFVFVAASTALTAVEPATGSVDGSTFTRITGTNIAPGCWPFFGDRASWAANRVSAAELIATTPAHAAGATDVSLRCGTAAAAALRGAFTFSTAPDAAPIVISVTPMSAAAGDSVIVRGSHFTARDRVTFNSTPATILSSAPDSLVVRVPSITAGVVAITVADASGASSTTGPVFTVLEATPQITSVAPRTVRAGSEIVIDGSGFRSDQAITIGGARATVVSTTFTRVIARVPEIAEGIWPISVGGVAGPSISVVASGVAVTSVTPACATSDGGATITIGGSGFEDGASVTIDGVAADAVVMSSSTITAKVPPGTPGAAVIVVRNANGDSGTLTGAFTMVSPFDPNGVCGPRKRRAGR
jgi:hypothetical protein